MITLTHLRVDSYRSLHNFKIDLQPFTVLIGRNDAGKSSVLNAIRLLLEDGATAGFDRYDWSRAAKATRFPRETAITGKLGGQNPLTIRRRLTIYKDAPADSILEIQEGPLWRLARDDERKLIPSFYYLSPRTGALEEAFDPSKENNIFTLLLETGCRQH